MLWLIDKLGGWLLFVLLFRKEAMKDTSETAKEIRLIVGALIVGVFRNGLTLMGVSSVYQVLITGILVILAVATDQLSRRRGR